MKKALVSLTLLAGCTMQPQEAELNRIMVDLQQRGTNSIYDSKTDIYMSRSLPNRVLYINSPGDYTRKEVVLKMGETPFACMRDDFEEYGILYLNGNMQLDSILIEDEYTFPTSSMQCRELFEVFSVPIE